MPKLQTFVTQPMLENLKTMSEKSGKPLSKISAELIEIGFQVQQLQEDNKAKPEKDVVKEMLHKHSEYLLRIIAVTSDILFCTHNNKSKHPDKTAKDALLIMKEYIRTYLEEHPDYYSDKNM